MDVATAQPARKLAGGNLLHDIEAFGLDEDDIGELRGGGISALLPLTFATFSQVAQPVGATPAMVAPWLPRSQSLSDTGEGSSQHWRIPAGGSGPRTSLTSVGELSPPSPTRISHKAAGKRPVGSPGVDRRPGDLRQVDRWQ